MTRWPPDAVGPELVATMRKVARVVPGAREVIAAVCVLDYAKAGKPDIGTTPRRAGTGLHTGQRDALAVLNALCGPDGHNGRCPGGSPDALGLLGLVAGRDVAARERLRRRRQPVADGRGRRGAR